MVETGENNSPAAKPNPETTSTPPPPPQAQPQTRLEPESQTPLQPQPLPQQPQTEPSRLTEPDFIYIPSYSSWFSWNSIHECEVRFLPEFFDGRSPSKNPRTYKYYRNAIIRRFRDNSSKKITFTEARKTIIGDVGSIRRVFDFLETWGLVNYTASSSKSFLKWEEKEREKDKEKESKSTPASASQNGTSTDFAVPKKKLCSACKSVCSIACFACDKYDLTLCARCYVRRNHRGDVNSTEFRRVEISEAVKTDWSDKETLQLLEALMHYGDDWKKVSEHVGGRSEKECVARFVKLPFGEQFISADVDNEPGSETPTKRIRLTPLADASNPIMAQAAFLSALAGREVAELAAHAAITALSEVGEGVAKGSLPEKQGSDSTSNGYGKDTPFVEARSQLEKEMDDLEKAVTDVAVETREIEDKLAGFEERDLKMDREWQQLIQLKNLTFIDQLTLLLNKGAAAAKIIGEEVVEPNDKIPLV